MLEYIFFNAELRDEFVAFVQSQNLNCESREDPLGLVVAVDEDNLDDVTEDKLEACYEELEQRQAELLMQEAGGLKQIAGFRANLPDGQSCQVALPPELANRLMECFTLDEIQVLVDTVAKSVLAPQQHLCQILREQTQE